MTITAPAASTSTNLLDELHAWLEENWDPDLTVGEWWGKLGRSGWAAPILPRERYGRGVSQGEALEIHRAVIEYGALTAPMGLGLMLAAPTIASHGTPEQVEAYIPDIVTGRKAWCQLFSEPGAGSDLAGLTTRAVAEADTWIINGQKVWTSGGHLADMGMLIARTNPDAPKHAGITWFSLDMHQPGVDVRPLREMTGSTMFSEVFMTDALVSDDARIGEVNNGWRVANTTLLFERTGMGAGGGGPVRGAVAVTPGTVAGNLERRAGDFVAPRSQPKGAADASERTVSPAQTYIDLARQQGKSDDPLIRSRLVRLHILGEVSRLNTERSKAARQNGREVPGVANFSKLMMADILRLSRDLGMQILGANGLLHAYDKEQRAVLADVPGAAEAAPITGSALSAQALPIFGGTDQIQRNIVGERTLGLPKDPGDLHNVPFSQLPKNG